MYGTLYRLHPKAGQEQRALDHLFRWEQERLPNVTGYVAGYIFEPPSTPGEIMGLFVFDSQVSYCRHRDDPEQDQWFEQLLPLLEGAPQWHDGEITELLEEARGLAAGANQGGICEAKHATGSLHPMLLHL